MLKLSRTGYGLLNAQYRSVLRKCMLLNMAAVFMFPAAAFAAGTAADSGSLSARLDQYMGTEINGQEQEDISALYVHGNFSNEIYSTEGNLHSWLINLGTVQIGWQYDATSGQITEVSNQTVISNRHNTGADMIYTGGGVIANGGKASSDSVLKVQNTLFSNNSASKFWGSSESFGDPTVGGVIANFSTVQAEIKKSTFTGNYVMGDAELGGGAIYNGTNVTQSGEITQGKLLSQNNTYSNNYVGNQTSNATLRQEWLNAGGKTASSAVGGAIYNTGEFISDGDTYTGNYVVADNASGGAIYNSLASIPGSSVTTGGSVTLKNIITFTGNYAEATSSNGLAYGGAIYNDKTITAQGATLNFINNHVSAGNKAQGGAIYIGSNGTMDIINGAFRGNTATGLGDGNAQGGAVANYSSEKITNSASYANNKVIAENAGEALGGAISNEGSMESAGQVYIENSASSVSGSAYGGAVANKGTYVSNNEVYKNNYAQSGKDAAGGALYNVSNTGNVSFTGNNVSFIENGVTGENAYGGAVLNGFSGTFIANGSNYSIEFTGNYASGSEVAVGGAIGNIFGGEMTVSGAKFSENYANGLTALGGAIANAMGKTTNITGSIFENNYISATEQGAGGAFFNMASTSDILTTLTDSSFNNNLIKMVGSGADSVAQGGAIYNNGLEESSIITQLKILSKNQNVTFSNNKIQTSRGESSGGAIYNGEYGQLTIENSSSGGKIITFSENTAVNGGAIFNAAGGENVNVGGKSITATFLLNAVSGDIMFTSNTATENGGALNNTAAGTSTIAVANSAVRFSDNSAKQGGGVYNAGGGTVLMQLGKNGVIAFAQNRASTKGGAILNTDSTLKLENTSTADVSNLFFAANTAQAGAAIYNQGTGNITGTLKKDTTIKFDGNVATDGLGGAIYNEKNATINISLADSSKIVFNTTGDDVYNEGTITITGDSAAPTLPEYASSSFNPKKMKARSINTSLTQVILNSTFGGNGTYNISNTQLNVGSSGYIDDEPVMNLTDNTINLASGSHINLGTDDTLSNNDFFIAGEAKLKYTADETTPDVALANTVVNSGAIDLRDGILSNIEINTLTSHDGTIFIDVNNPAYAADIITINNRIYGTTNIVFDNQDTLYLEDQKIYFAQTQLEQSLDDYKFNTYIVNNIYEIKIGYEEDGDVYKWFMYRDTSALAPEVMAYIDLPRSAIEQTRSIMFDISRTNKGVCDCRRGICSNNIYCRYGQDDAKSRLWAKPVYRNGNFKHPVKTDVSVYGVDFGYDYQPTFSDMFGFFGSYRKGKYENNGIGHKPGIYSNQSSELEISSILGGLYYRKYFGNLYMNGTVYGGTQSVDMKAENDVKASVDGINLGASAEIGYDIRTSRRSVLTPFAKATYDYIKFDSLVDNSYKRTKFEGIHDVELEAGLKFEYQFNNEYQLPTTAYIKPSVVQMLGSGGRVHVAGTEFDDTLENTTLGRVEVGADAELIENFSVGAFGNYTFGSTYRAWGVGGNIKYVW